MNEIKFNVAGYEVTNRSEVYNQIRDFVVEQVETKKKDCRFSCAISLDDDEWTVMSYLIKKAGSKNYSLVFSVRKSGTYTWEQMEHDFNFGTLAGTNVNMLIATVMGKFDDVVAMMIAEGGKMSVDEQMFNEVKETIEEMVENETPFMMYDYGCMGVVEHIFPNGLDIEERFATKLRHKIEKYYDECMRAKLSRLYNADGNMYKFEFNRLVYGYLNMLKMKWRFILEFGDVKTEVKMVNEEIENAVKNDAPLLDDVVDEVDVNDVVNDIVGVIKDNLMPLGYTEGQKLDWGLFENGTMEYCFKHGAEVYDKVIKIVPQISDALAYDDCFYVWYSEEYPKIVKEKMEMETRVYEIVEELCEDMEDGKMIEYGDYMIGLQFGEDSGCFNSRKPEWWQSMVFVIKKEDIDEDGYYDLDECGEVFCIEHYFEYFVELLRGDVDIVGQIRDNVVQYIKNNRVYKKVS